MFHNLLLNNMVNIGKCMMSLVQRTDHYYHMDYYNTDLKFDKSFQNSMLGNYKYNYFLEVHK